MLKHLRILNEGGMRYLLVNLNSLAYFLLGHTALGGACLCDCVLLQSCWLQNLIKWGETARLRRILHLSVQLFIRLRECQSIRQRRPR